MHNTVKIAVLVLLLLAVSMTTVYCSLTSGGKTAPKHYQYEKSTDILKNPLVGYAPSADSKTSATGHSLVYIDVLWSELEPTEGKFSFDQIDEDNYVKKWTDEGKHAVLRFVCDRPSDKRHMDIPKWLYNKTGDGTYYSYSGKNGYSPDYSNPTFIKYHELAIKALGSHFGGSTFVSYVEFGSLGHWGEWHVNYESGIKRLPTADIREKYVTPYITAFPNAKMLMRRPFNTAKQHGFGVYNDLAGHPASTEEWLKWIDEGGDYAQALETDALSPMPDAWKTAPIGGEFTSDFEMDYLLKFNKDTTKDLLKRSHTTFLGPKSPTQSVIDKYKCQSQADEIEDMMGYRFRISDASLKGTFKNADSSITLTWANDGIAPIYWNWKTYIYICDKNKKVLSKVPVDIKLTSLLPEKGMVTTTAVPKASLPGTAKYVCLGIEDPMTGKPAIKFGMKTEYIDNMAVLAQIGN